MEGVQQGHTLLHVCLPPLIHTHASLLARSECMFAYTSHHTTPHHTQHHSPPYTRLPPGNTHTHPTPPSPPPPDYHEARERLLGNSLSHGSGSTGNLQAAAAAAAAGSNAGSRPGSAGANRPAATAGAGYLAAVPPTAGERGFNLVNPGRGAGRGGPNPGRGSGGRGGGAAAAGSNDADAAAAAADGAAAEADGQQQQGEGAQVGGGQQQQHKQQQRRQQQQQGGQRGGGGGGRGPKAVYRDRQRDELDPDYARGVDRCVLASELRVVQQITHN